ncbi:Uncharacterised protein [Mammaliicoccus fleurettii]|nr:Uncharacterised protein [Mammaliicoccus fleurettii]
MNYIFPVGLIILLLILITLFIPLVIMFYALIKNDPEIL